MHYFWAPPPPLLSTISATPTLAQEVLRRQMRGSYAWSEGPCAQGAAFYRGRDGRRHYCY